jgi:hypothetical protein
VLIRVGKRLGMVSAIQWLAWTTGRQTEKEPAF